MKKVSRKNLEGLLGCFTTINNTRMRSYIGGVGSNNVDKDTSEPNTPLMNSADNTLWNDIDIMPMSSGGLYYDPEFGYMLPDVYIYGYYSGSGSGNHGSGGYYPEQNDDSWGDHWNSNYYGYYGYGYGYGGGSGGGGGGSSTGSGHWDTDNDPYKNLRNLYGSSYGSNEEKWAALEEEYKSILSKLGINIENINFEYSEERYARAWVDQSSNTIYIGYNMFKKTAEDSISILFHEYIHLQDDQPYGTTSVDIEINYYKDVPENIKDYVTKVFFDGKASEQELSDYFTTDHIYEPNHYLNDVNAYEKEKEMFPDVSKDYAEERDFRIWYYNNMAKIAKNYH